MPEMKRNVVMLRLKSAIFQLCPCHSMGAACTGSREAWFYITGHGHTFKMSIPVFQPISGPVLVQIKILIGHGTPHFPIRGITCILAKQTCSDSCQVFPHITITPSIRAQLLNYQWPRDPTNSQLPPQQGCGTFEWPSTNHIPLSTYHFPLTNQVPTIHKCNCGSP